MFPKEIKNHQKEKKKKPCGQTTDRGIPNLVCIQISQEGQWWLKGEVKAMEQSSFQIPKNFEKYKPWCNHEVTNNVDFIENAWSSNSEVDQNPNQLSIDGGIKN